MASFKQDFRQLTTFDIRRTRYLFGKLLARRMDWGISLTDLSEQVVIRVYYDGMLEVRRDMWKMMSYRGERLLNNLIYDSFESRGHKDGFRVYKRKSLLHNTQESHSLVEYLTNLR